MNDKPGWEAQYRLDEALAKVAQLEARNAELRGAFTAR